jgi:hypothetical protein
VKIRMPSRATQGICTQDLNQDSCSDLGNASTVQFQCTCALEINTVLCFVELHDPDDFVVEVDRRSLGGGPEERP